MLIDGGVTVDGERWSANALNARLFAEPLTLTDLASKLPEMDNTPLLSRWLGRIFRNILVEARA
jgi:hypothetical protein